MSMTTPADAARHTASGSDPIDVLLAEGRGSSRAGALTASAAFGIRALLKLKHDPKQLVDSAAIPILFTVLFTYLFGGAISGSTGDYLTSLLPGVLSMSIAVVTMYGGARLAQDLRSGAFERVRGLPVWRGAFVFGGLLSDAARYLFASAIVVGLGLAMGYRPEGAHQASLRQWHSSSLSDSRCRWCGQCSPWSSAIRRSSSASRTRC
ncbi:ABC transporter permease [Yinghuangia aomiensis]